MRLAFPAFMPSLRATVLIAGFAPVALLVGALLPAAWIVAPALGGALLLLVLLDAAFAGRLEDLRLVAPGDCEVGRKAQISILAELSGRYGTSAPVAAVAVDARLHGDGRIVFPLSPDQGVWSGSAALTPSRRGTGTIDRIWLKWSGPLGLATRTASRPVGGAIRVWPDISPVKSPALQIFLRDAQFGLIARRIRGEGTEFEAMADYEPGMDRRRIDWKASARHGHLFAKEFDTERNNQIVFAFDCGAAMCEPVDGLPRIDRAVTAALTTAYVALRAGDRVSLFGFAARPDIATPFVSGSRHFHRLQSAAAGLDYHAEEPNFTLALSTLSARLQRRSMIVLFSEFTDPTSAELMIENVGRLVDRHLVVFVVLSDAELADIAEREPDGLQAVAMAVTASTLQRQRAIVLQRLRHLGVRVVEAPWQQVGMRLLDTYLSIKREGSIG